MDKHKQIEIARAEGEAAMVDLLNQGMDELAKGLDGYSSPIDVIRRQMSVDIEKGIMKAVENVGITVDKEELIKALQFDRGQYDRGYADACKKFVGLLHERMRYKYQGTGLWWTEIVLMAEEICKEITEGKDNESKDNKT